MAKKYLTELEKACLCYCYFTGKKIKNAYSLAHNNKTISQPSLSVWVNSDPVKTYILELQQRDNSRLAVMGSGNGNESRNGNGVLSTEIDFTDISQFIKFLNSQANNISDESHKQKYLSMLSDLLRFKESGTDKNSELQRFYIPLTCKECELYKQHKQ